MSSPKMLLLPVDLPGALLKNNLSIEEHSVAELQRWLECRGYKKSGVKLELIERVKNCINNGQDQKISPGIDNGKWYDLKRNLNQNAQVSRQYDDLQLILARAKWGRFPSCCIPEYFNKGHIYTYIIGENVQNEDPDIEINDEENVVTSVKPFRRGSQYVDSDHVSEIYDSSNGSHYFAKCKCQSSFRKKVLYTVVIVLNKISGAVVKGTCECKQSTLGKCSHVTAFLILICRHVEKYGTGVVPPTSRPREWGIGSRKRNPGQTSKSTYPMKRLKPLKRAEFDPRPTNYTREVDFNSFVVDLQKGDKLSMFQKILKVEYEDFQYSLEELDICSLQTQQFLDNMRKFLNNFPTELIEIPGTVQGSEDWYRWRTYFITSSNAKVVSRLISENAKKNFLLRNLWRSLPPVMTAAMLYGKRSEPLARKAYLKDFVGEDEILQQLGLVVNKNYPCFATSIDGLVMTDDGVIDRLIEIKCPKVLENCSNLSDFNKYLTKKQLSNFFLERQNFKYVVKNNHPYLYQILMSLIIFDLNICHLVVWNPKDILVICVRKNRFPEIVEEIKTKLENFYKTVYVPEMFNMRCVRDLNAIELI